MVKSDNILVICAHSDDQILGLGATLAKYAGEGKNIFTVICTFGEKANPWLKEDVAIKIRVREAEKADKVIGGKEVIFLGLTERDFKEGIEKHQFNTKIQTIIKNKRPVKIFTHSPEDPHPMHRFVLKKTLEALDSIRFKCDVFSFDVWNPFSFKKSDFTKLYVDVSDTFQVKIKALKCFPSQWPSIWSLLWSVYVKALIHGFHIHKKYAERFFKIR